MFTQVEGVCQTPLNLLAHHYAQMAVATSCAVDITFDLSCAAHHLLSPQASLSTEILSYDAAWAKL